MSESETIDETYEEKPAERTESPQGSKQTPSTDQVARVEAFPALRADVQMQLLKEQCQIFLNSGLLPTNIKNWAQAFTIANYGREIGLRPLESFQDIYIVNGKPSMSAKLMKRRVHEKFPNAIFQVIEHTETSAKVKVCRDRTVDEPTEWIMTREECDKANFTKAPNYKKGGVIEEKAQWKAQPATMLLYRLISKVCRVEFPDCLGSVAYTPDELDAEEDTKGRPIHVDADSEGLNKFNNRMTKLANTMGKR